MVVRNMDVHKMNKSSNSYVLTMTYTFIKQGISDFMLAGWLAPIVQQHSRVSNVSYCFNKYKYKINNIVSNSWLPLFIFLCQPTITNCHYKH